MKNGKKQSKIEKRLDKAADLTDQLIGTLRKLRADGVGGWQEATDTLLGLHAALVNTKKQKSDQKPVAVGSGENPA